MEEERASPQGRASSFPLSLDSSSSRTRAPGPVRSHYFFVMTVMAIINWQKKKKKVMRSRQLAGLTGREVALRDSRPCAECQQGRLQGAGGPARLHREVWRGAGGVEAENAGRGLTQLGSAACSFHQGKCPQHQAPWHPSVPRATRARHGASPPAKCSA